MTEGCLSSEAKTNAGKQARSNLKVAGIAAGCALLVAFIALVLMSPTEEKFMWLSPTQFAQNTRPSRFTSLKWKVESLTAPVWSRFHKPLHICVEGKLLLIHEGAIENLGMGAPATTNADGLCAWILQPKDSLPFRGQIKSNFAVTIMPGLTILTGSGGQASVSSMSSGAPGMPQTGTKMDVLPKYSGGSIKLVLSVSTTDRTTSAANTFVVQTNLDAACQLTVADGGSVLLGKRSSSNGTSCYMLISATAQDAKGKRIGR